MLGLTPGARPTVAESAGDGVVGPGVTLGSPGANELPGMPGVVGEPGVLPGAVPGVLGDAPGEVVEPVLPPVICAEAAAVSSRRATILGIHFMS